MVLPTAAIAGGGTHRWAHVHHLDAGQDEGSPAVIGTTTIAGRRMSGYRRRTLRNGQLGRSATPGAAGCDSSVNRPVRAAREPESPISYTVITDPTATTRATTASATET